MSDPGTDSLSQVMRLAVEVVLIWAWRTKAMRGAKGSATCCHVSGRDLLSSAGEGALKPGASATCQSACVKCRLASGGCSVAASE